MSIILEQDKTVAKNLNLISLDPLSEQKQSLKNEAINKELVNHLAKIKVLSKNINSIYRLAKANYNLDKIIPLSQSPKKPSFAALRV